MGDNAGRLDVLTRQTPAPTPSVARAGDLSLDDMWRQALILSKSGLVPKALKDNPEGTMLVGMRGAELGWSFTTALDFIDVFEGRAVINAQGGLAVIRKAGHRARFVHEECDETQAVIIGQRREPDGWGPEERITWTIEEARTAGLLDEWVEQYVKKPGDKWDSKEKFVLRREGNGYVPGKFGATTMPAWVTKKIADGEVKHKDNWWNYPGDQLKARAAARLRRNVFSDVMAAYGVDRYTAEEMGATATGDLDETEAAGGAEDPDDDIADAELVEQGEDVVMPTQVPEGAKPRAHTGAASAPAHPGGAVSASDPAVPSGPTDEQDEVYANRRRRANAVMGEVGVKADDARHQLVNTATGGATQSTGRLTAWQVEAIIAFCDRLKTDESGEGLENGDAQVVGASAVPPPSGPVPGEWRARAAEQGVSDARLLIMAREVASALGVAPPPALDRVTDEVAAGVLERLG